MTWKLTLGCNVAILFLFWGLSLLAILPAYNYLIEYPDAALDLPAPTEIAIRFRLLAGILPLLAGVLAVPLLRRLAGMPSDRRNEILAAQRSASLVLGLALFGLFLLAGILPFLRIAAPT